MDRTGRRTALWNWRTAVITFAASLATAAVPIVSLANTLIDRDGAIASLNATVDRLEDDLDTATATLESRQTTIDELRTENTKLRAAVPYTVAAEDVHAIRKVDTLTLAAGGDTVDLNSTEPHFGANRTSTATDSLRFNGQAVLLGYGISVVSLPDGTIGTYATCAAASGYAPTQKLEPHLLTSPTTCLRLQSDRFATLQVNRFDAESTDMTITVWE